MGMLQTDIESFLTYLLSERGLSPNTADSYRIDLEQFALLALQRGARRTEDLLESHVLAWIAQLEGRKAADATIARKLTALHSFAKFLVIDDVHRPVFRVDCRQPWAELRPRRHGTPAWPARRGT